VKCIAIECAGSCYTLYPAAGSGFGMKIFLALLFVCIVLEFGLIYGKEGSRLNDRSLKRTDFQNAHLITFELGRSSS
jgi:hypothetical protein